MPQVQKTISAALAEYCEGFNTRNQENLGGLQSLCPHCGTLVAFEALKPVNLNTSRFLAAMACVTGASADGQADRLLHQLVCPNQACKGLVIVASGYYEVDENQQLFLTLMWPNEVWPNNAPESLDSDARQDYDEARRVLALSPAAAAALTRRCLQFVIRKQLEITDSTLFKEIERASADDRLSQSSRSSLDHVRKIGNFAAHPDIDEAQVLVRVSRNQAEYTLRALERLFHDLYTAPGEIAEMAQLLAAEGKTDT